MPLNILVLAVPQEARDTARWLRSVASPAESSTSAIHQVRGASESDWQGEAGEGMRAGLADLGRRGDEVVEIARSFADALEVYADGMDTVRRRMDDARRVATNGGLTVTDTEIHDPPKVADLLTAPGASIVENSPDHQAKVAARQAKIDAYEEAEQHVKAGRDTQHHTESELQKFISSQFNKSWVTAGTAITGYAGVQLKTRSTWRAGAAKHAEMAAALEKFVHNPLVPASTQSEMISTYAKHKVNATEIPQGSDADRLPARAMDKLPQWAKSSINAGLGPEHFRFNFAGGLLTGASATVDVASGKDPGKVTATNTTGTLASMGAAGIGTMVGGGAMLTVGVPLVVGTVVSTGMGYVYDSIAAGDKPSWTTENGQFRTPPMSR